jgi:hypothetical protein
MLLEELRTRLLSLAKLRVSKKKSPRMKSLMRKSKLL